VRTSLHRSLEGYPNETYCNDMDAITLKAHFDGERIQLDEPFELTPNTPLMVTVLSPHADAEQAQWTHAAVAGLARAYSDDEPDYSVADVKQ
jgi:hypothetical protein